MMGMVTVAAVARTCVGKGCNDDADADADADPGRFWLLRCKALTVERVVDSTGAGDVFIAGLLHAVLAGCVTHPSIRT